MRIVIKLLKSSSLQAALGFGMGGAAFAIGNLLLARVMPLGEYGVFALAIALFNTFWPLAPLGYDEASLRCNSPLDGSTFGRVTVTGLGVALVAAVIAYLFYRVELLSAGLLIVAIVLAGLTSVACAALRREGHQTTALIVNNSANWVIVAAGVVSLASGIHSANFALILLAGGVGAGCIAGWAVATRAQARSGKQHQKITAMEALNFVSILGAGTLMLQLERLVAPKLLGIEALASLSVLASVAIFPFRMLRSGVGFSLVPKLRRARSVVERDRVIRDEVGSVLAMALAASFVVLLLSPPLTRIITGGRYELSLFLVAAACVNGAAKVITGLPRVFITACGQQADIRSLNWQSWLMIVLGIAGAWIGSGYDLAGLVAGAGIGTLAGSVPSMFLAYRVLHRSKFGEETAYSVEGPALHADQEG